MKPVLIKIGLPLALSAAAYACANIISTKHFFSTITAIPGGLLSRCAFSPSNPVKAEQNPNFPSDGERSKNLSDQQISCLQEQFEDKVSELESRFLRSSELKEREMCLLRHEILLEMKMIRAENIEREVSGRNAECRMIESLLVVIDGSLKAMKLRSAENELLRRKVCGIARKVKKLRVTAAHHSAIMRSNTEQMATGMDIINTIKKDNEELTSTVDQMKKNKHVVVPEVKQINREQVKQNHTKQSSAVTAPKSHTSSERKKLCSKIKTWACSTKH